LYSELCVFKFFKNIFVQFLPTDTVHRNDKNVSWIIQQLKTLNSFTPRLKTQ